MTRDGLPKSHPCYYHLPREQCWLRKRDCTKARRQTCVAHWLLCNIMPKRPTDFEPYGQRDRDTGEPNADCSCGCLWWFSLEIMPADWGVCVKPDSPRCGLLTFEHQGCPKFEGLPEKDWMVDKDPNAYLCERVLRECATIAAPKEAHP